MGGFPTINAFTEYAKVCFEAYGDRVKHWITINEPWTMSVIGYTNGLHAPGYYGSGGAESRDTYKVAHNLLLAHGRVAKLYKNEFAESQKGMIGISNSGDFRFPKDKNSGKDQEAAQRGMEFQLGWFADPIWGPEGDYPQSMREILGDRLPHFTSEEKEMIRGSSDFFGLNHYSSALASQPEVKPTYGGYWADMNVDVSFDPTWRQNQMGWGIVPEGLRKMLNWIDERYGNPIIFITENGDAEDEPDLETALNDYGRLNYFDGYLSAAKDAIDEDGVDLQGYFAWSLMDNFEWAFGYTRRFGLCRVDYDTLERTPKSSAKWFKRTIETNGGNIIGNSYQVRT